MRVHELAKELGLASKEILAKLHELGVEASSHMSALDETSVSQVREALAKDTAAPVVAPAVATAATPKTPPPTAPAKPAAPAPTAAPAAAQPRPAQPAKPVTPAPAPAPAPAPVPAVPAQATPAPVPEQTQAPKPAPPAAVHPAGAKAISIPGPITVKDLAALLDVRPNRLVAELMGMNVLASINERVDVAVARKVAESHGFTFEHEKKEAEYKQVQRRGAEAETGEEEDREEDLQPRPPVVTFLGHVDHGKTSLLDKIRNTAVAKGEHGGITQHIGAYTVDVGGRAITFLDTPGHAAFTAMRARGANLTDIAVIIIAADDGIMPQTREAIMHAKAAQVSLMVAINKIDLPTANPDRVKQQLQAEGLTPEDWGGETICAPVSAQTGAGIAHLLEMILLQAEVLELRANPRRRAAGFVIEARLEPGMGPTSNLLVTAGTLTVGDYVLCGRYCGRVRALINDHGVKVKSAKPSTPIKCLGLAGVPMAGCEFRVCVSEKAARVLAEGTREREEREQLSTPRKASLSSLFDQLAQNEKLELKIILKTDTQGSLEAISHALREIKSDKVSLTILLGATGNVTSNDVMLASASNAVVLGFHVSKESGVDGVAKHEGVEIRLHHIIYELLDQVRDAMTGLLSPQKQERVTGAADVKQVFPIGKTGKIAGCRIARGFVTSKSRVRVKRGDGIVAESVILSLRHFQESVAEVRESQECGIRLENFNNFEPGDVLEFYHIEEVQQTL